MAFSAYDADPVALLKALLATIEADIIPLTLKGVTSGSKLFGAAILSKAGLVPLTVSTNNEVASPLLHGEINCIRQFFAQTLCLSGITWSGFDNFFYLFTYEDSRDLFSIPYDIDILQEVFRVPAVSASPSGKEMEGEDLDARPLYNRRNKFFTARSFEDLVREVAEKHGETESKKWGGEVRRVKALYNELSDTYQKGNKGGTESASFWK
ncbi:cytidine deoxycytidylate deaminase family protein [Xylaria telfairii]|nr:cytidine deoxycytidylate deaminase family protein [Xylaria telfairii]